MELLLRKGNALESISPGKMNPARKLQRESLVEERSALLTFSNT